VRHAYTVHTSAEARAAGERHIRELKRLDASVIGAERLQIQMVAGFSRDTAAIALQLSRSQEIELMRLVLGLATI